MAMKSSTGSYNEPASRAEPLALRDHEDLNLPDWSEMRPIPHRPPVEVVFETCEQWLQALPNRRQLQHQREQRMCLVEFVV